MFILKWLHFIPHKSRYLKRDYKSVHVKRTLPLLSFLICIPMIFFCRILKMPQASHLLASKLQRWRSLTQGSLWLSQRREGMMTRYLDWSVLHRLHSLCADVYKCLRHHSGMPAPTYLTSVCCCITYSFASYAVKPCQLLTELGN